MMLQTKHKYFNNKIKILLLILMWTLIWQHVYGKSSTYDVGSSSVVAANAAYDDANGIGDMVEESTAANKQITSTAMETKSTTTSSSSSSTTTTTATTENGGNNNNATIYDHINENDNNSNKLSQNVAKRDQQQQQQHQQAKMMEIGMPPPTEQVLMAKDQLNKIEDKIPKDKDDYDNDNDYENKQEESKDSKMSMAKVNDIITGGVSIMKNSSSSSSKIDQSNDKHLNRNLNVVTTESYNDETTTLSYTTVENDDDDDGDLTDGTQNFNRDKNSFPKGVTDYKNIQNSKETSDTKAFLQQQLIHHFAIKYKKIPRVTLFTCRQTASSTVSDDNNANSIDPRQTKINMNTVELLRRVYLSEPTLENIPKAAIPSKRSANLRKNRASLRTSNDLMIKIVQIDHLISKRRTNINNAGPRRGYTSGARGSSYNIVGGPTSRNTFTNAHWLEQVLRVEPLRQIVVLDLSCGATSRRLLEMASNKALFNSMYHWLLMEDYVFNRQTEIDDADDIKNKKMNTSSTSSSISSSGSGSKSSKEEVVSDSNSTMQVKKLNTYTSDVVGASASGSGKQYGSQHSVSTATSSSVFYASSTTGNRESQRRLVNDSTATSTGDTVGGADEDDMEIIEKFLEKFNININSELILAKRRNVADWLLSASIPSIMMPSLTNFASSKLDDYNTLQKMDYYMLYDVWSPGLQYGGVVNISDIGYFTLDHGFELADWFRNTSTVTRRFNMNMAKIRCLIVITHKNRSDTLETYLTTPYDTHLDSMNRFNFALLSHVRDLFNFSFILSNTSSWGYFKNGKFDGMIGALVRKQADIGGSPIFFRIERAKVIDYTTRTWVARPCFIFRHPRSTKKDRIVFLQPFSNDVWILLAICGCTTIFQLWILTSLERRFVPEYEIEPAGAEKENVKAASHSDRQQVNTNGTKTVSGGGFKRRFVRWGGIFCGQDVTDNLAKRRIGLFFESFLFYIGSICQQGLAFSTRFFSGRCIVITSLLFSFSIYQFYSASIVGTLLMEKPKTIRTLRDLIHSSLEIGIEDIAYNRDYFLRTKDPDAQELYAKKVTSIPATGENGYGDAPPDNLPTQATELTAAQKTKAYRDILHSHETGAHAKTNEASNWYDPEYGVIKIKKGRFAFHVDVATAYKIIADSFSEKEICDLTEIQLFPPQKMVNIVQKGSPLRKIITYGLRRITEVGLTDYQRKIWHSPKPRCIKQLHTDDLRVDMQTFTSALLVLIFGYAVSLLILGLEIMHYKLWQRYTMATTTTTTTS